VGTSSALARLRLSPPYKLWKENSVESLRDIKVLMFDQYGTIVDMQTGLTEVVTPFLKRKRWDGKPTSFVTWWRRTHFENSMIDALCDRGHTPYREIGQRAVAYVMDRCGIGYTADEVAAIKDFVAFYWNRVDAWYEEDEEIFVHPRDPYKRVDVLDSTRSVQVVVGGQVVAETRRARFLFETRLPTRYYIPPEDVRMDLLVPSETVTRCPYKGQARYYSVKIGDKVFSDLVWTYPDPIPECPKIKAYLCFFNEQVDEIRVDGVPVPRPVTPWSKDWKEKAATVPDSRGPVVRP